MTTTADWNPDQYRRFADERSQPFYDLLDLIQREGLETGVDLGCGPGELTALAARQLGLRQMVGIDNSPTMLAATREFQTPSVQFRNGDLATWSETTPVDLVIAAASLQWVPDHAEVITRWRGSLRPGGQIAVQVPANSHAATHVIASQLAREEPFLSAFGPSGPPIDPVHENVVRPDDYARILRNAGFSEQKVFLRVYPHVLADADAVISWVRGTTLTRFARSLPPSVFEVFVENYSERIRAHYGEDQPVFFPFSRILFWGQLPR